MEETLRKIVVDLHEENNNLKKVNVHSKNLRIVFLVNSFVKRRAAERSQGAYLVWWALFPLMRSKREYLV